MSDPKHTPGPWVVFDSGDKPGIDQGNGVSIVQWGLESCDSGINCRSEADPQTAREERMANAHLIAAAPDLLAALEQLNSYVKSSYGVSPSTFAADAEIKKAKGETE